MSCSCHTAPSVVFGTAGDDHTLVSDTSPWILSTFCEASKSPAQRPSWDLATDSQWDGSPPRLGSSQEEEEVLPSEISPRTRQHPPFTVLFTALQGSPTLLQMLRCPAAPPAGYPSTRDESEDCSTPVATSAATRVSSCRRTAPSARTAPSRIPSTARCMGPCKAQCMGRCRFFPGPPLPLTQAASTVHTCLQHLPR